MSRLIDADLYKKNFCNRFCSVKECTSTQKKSCCIAISLQDEPTIKIVPPVQGEWKKISNRPKTYIRRCSACGRDSYTCLSEIDYNYCPWCGADMRKQVE